MFPRTAAVFPLSPVVCLRRRCALAIFLILSCVPACRAPSPGGSCAGTTVQLRREKVLTVGVDLSYPPFAFDDPKTREPTGYEIDLVTAIAKELGLKVILENRTSAALIPGVIAGRHDLAASALRDTPDLKRGTCTSEPYLDADLGVLVAGAEIEGTGDLADHVVAVLKGGRADAWAKTHLGDAKIERLAAPEDLLSSLQSGRVDAVVDDLPALRYAAKTTSGLELVETIGTDDRYVLVASPENKGLIDLVNRALENIRTTGRIDRIERKWFGDT